MQKRTEGIILQKVPFKERDLITTLFTPDLGVVKIFFKRAKALSPLAKVEVIFTEGKTDLYSAKEVHVLDHFLSLRKDYDTLEAAGQMLKTILSAHLFHRPTPALYALLCSYLHHLPAFSNPYLLSLSFHLKLLRHEGVLHLSETCSVCPQPATTLSQGESFCRLHTSKNTPQLTQDELSHLHHLAYGKNYKLFHSLDVDKNTCTKLLAATSMYS